MKLQVYLTSCGILVAIACIPGVSDRLPILLTSLVFFATGLILNDEED